MIVKNEASQLPRCLDSVKSAVDEIVILDTGSSDRTPEIAQAYGARVHFFPWCDNFSTARNESLKYATGDWILVLDADEVFVPAVMPLLQQAMQQEDAIVINLIRQEIGAIQSPYSLVSRLFRNHSAIHFSRPYHAMVDDSVMQLQQREPHWQILNCSEVAILHYGYEPGAIASRNKLEKAKTLMEGFWKSHPNDPYVCSKLGALYVQMEEFNQGIPLLEHGLQVISDSQPLVSSAQSPILYELHYHLGIAYTRMGQVTKAEPHYQAALQQPIADCLKLGAYNNLGNLLKAKGNLTEAQAAYETTLAIDPRFATGHYNLGMTLKAMGNLAAAVDCYKQAIALNPSYAEAYQNLGVALLKLGAVSASMDAFRQAIDLHAQQNSPESDRLRQTLQEMGFRVE